MASATIAHFWAPQSVRGAPIVLSMRPVAWNAINIAKPSKLRAVYCETPDETLAKAAHKWDSSQRLGSLCMQLCRYSLHNYALPYIYTQYTDCLYIAR